MKKGIHKYYYKKVIKGIGYYGMVEVEVNLTGAKSRVIDNCKWKELKECYPKFQELEILNIWKASAIKAGEYLINNLFVLKKVEIIIHDISGTYLDTSPSNIVTAIFIAVFDLIGYELSIENLNRIDNFVIENSNNELIPDFKLINLEFSI